MDSCLCLCSADEAVPDGSADDRLISTRNFLDDPFAVAIRLTGGCRLSSALPRFSGASPLPHRYLLAMNFRRCTAITSDDYHRR